jgi:hypothetical protein
VIDATGAHLQHVLGVGGVEEPTFRNAIDAPLPIEGGWNLSRIADIALAQSSYQLTEGYLWLPGVSKAKRTQLPISFLISQGLQISRILETGKRFGTIEVLRRMVLRGDPRYVKLFEQAGKADLAPAAIVFDYPDLFAPQVIAAANRSVKAELAR